MRMIAAAAATLLPILAARAEPPAAGPRVGDVYAIMRSYQTSEQDSDGSGGTSSGRDATIERVIALRDDGLELEYDLPSEVTAEDRARQWQFPARIFRPLRGPPQLLNRPELEARLEAWLQAARLPRAACGSWYFTWNAFRVECDPQTVVETVEGFDVGPADLRDGAPFESPGARGSAPLRRTAAGPDGATFVVSLPIDPDAVRRDLVESDLAVAEISRETLTREAAVRARASDEISGTVTITFETDAAGRAWRRVTVTEMEIRGPSRQSETRRAEVTLERRLVPGPAS